LRDAYCVKAGFGRLRGTASVLDAFVIPASEPVSSFSGCRIKSGMTIESPRQKRGGTNQKTEARRREPPNILPKQKRGGASRPKDNFILPPSDSAACAARLLSILSRGTASVDILKRLGLLKHQAGGVESIEFDKGKLT